MTTENKIQHQLVFRLSSLGDILLSLAYLENLPANTKVDWVTSAEFSFLLQNHPRIHKLYLFDKRTGFAGWVRLLSEIKEIDYSLRVDLHVTLRTRFARLYFLGAALAGGKFIQWKSVSKERVKTFLYLTFKNLLPPSLRPTRYWIRFAKLARSNHQANSKLLPPNFRFALKDLNLSNFNLSEQSYITVMPASRWSSKEWGMKNYLELLEKISKTTALKIVLLGRKNDIACADLAEELLQKNISYTSLLDEPDFSVTATVIAKSYAFLGSDTGLAHLAEAVGTKAFVIYGPTRPDLGFGPHQKESRAIFSEVFCSPCSKDGKVCYRFWQPYACLNKIAPDSVLKEITS